METGNGAQTAVLMSKNTASIHEDGFQTVLYVNGDNPAYFRHYHDYYEIVFYLGSRPLLYSHEDREYEVFCGDIVLCSIFEPHIFLCEKNASYDRFSVGVEPQFLLHYSAEDANLIRIFDKNNPNHPVFHTDSFSFSKYMDLIRIFQRLEVQTGKKAVQRALIHQLLAYLYSDCCGEMSLEAPQSRHIELVAELVRYIDDHLEERILLEHLAEMTNYSVAYICKVFKETTGETLIQYYLEKRIVWAKQLIQNGVPITEAADRTGFSNYSYFYKAFKKITGVGPREFKEQRAKAPVETVKL